MGKIIVGIGESSSTRNADDEIKTLALGSCVALIFLDPKTRVAGMVHIALPDSKIDPEKGKKLPGYFADTGLPHLLAQMREHGSIPHAGYITKLIGGANVMDKEDHFQIGKRNVTALKKLLWDLNLPITAEDVGGNISRTVSIEMQSGKVFIYSSEGKKWSI